MNYSLGISVEPQLEQRKIDKLARQELQTLAINKERLDLDFPEHSRMIPYSEFLGIARNKTFQKLCEPLESLEAQVALLRSENQLSQWKLC